MLARLMNRFASPPAREASQLKPPPKRPPGKPDDGYVAIRRLTALATELAAVETPTSSRWKSPPLFFYDRQREAQRKASQPPSTDPFAAISARIASELPALCRSVEVRRVARTVVGLHESARALAPVCDAARDLAELLAVPDDEVILVLQPEQRTGYRLSVRGIATVGQFYVLLASAIGGNADSGLPAGPPILERFISACRNRGPVVPAGVPMEMEARFQLYSPAAIRADGTLPAGFTGCVHWLWAHTPLAAIPRVSGERTVLLGPSPYRARWEVGPRFSGLAADLEVIEKLGRFRVAEKLSQLTGSPVSPVPHSERIQPLREAA